MFYGVRTLPGTRKYRSIGAIWRRMGAVEGCCVGESWKSRTLPWDVVACPMLWVVQFIPDRLIHGEVSLRQFFHLVV